MKRKKLGIAALGLAGILVFWFLGVDASEFVEDCPDCMYGRVILQYRVFTISIYQRTREHETVLHQVAADLGADCKHPKLARWQMCRFWGLLICARPCTGGTIWVSEGKVPWYDDQARSIVKDLVRTDPSLRGEFARRVLKDHDWEYWRSFCNRVESLRAAKAGAATLPS